MFPAAEGESLMDDGTQDQPTASGVAAPSWGNRIPTSLAGSRVSPNVSPKKSPGKSPAKSPAKADTSPETSPTKVCKHYFTQ